MSPYYIRYTLFVLLVYQSLEPSGQQRISIKNNGYRSIKVFLPGELPSVVNKTNVINSVKDLFISSSTTLYIATKRRAHFAEVIFVVPSSWGTSEKWLPDNANVSQSRLNIQEADIEISTDMKGYEPLTLHTGGCGEQAARIYLPLEFLLSADDDMESKSREFVYHWAQYRYGIFPEGGFPLDSRYPLYYSTPGTDEVEVTDCTNVPLSYTMRKADGSTCAAVVNSKTGRPEGSQCMYASATGNSTLLSSLMFQQGVTQMSQFCHGETNVEKVHNVAALSKHNALCGEESTWFVILRNQDFIKGRNQASVYRPQPPKFKYVQQSNFRVVVALETSAHMNINSRYRLVKNALGKLILYDLPSNSKFGLVSFSDEVAVKTLYPLDTKESRQRFFESVPFEEDAGSHFNRCITCAVNESIQLLLSDNDLEEGGVIILVATGSCENFLDDDVKKKLMTKNIKIFVLLFSQDEISGCAWESYSSPTGGSVHHIPEAVSENTRMMLIYLTFASIIKGYSFPSVTEVLLAEEIPPSETDVSLQFQVDSVTTNELRLFVTGSTFDPWNFPLVADDTFVRCGPDEEFTEFERQPIMPAWVFNIVSQQVSNCTFETKRKDGTSAPLLIVITQTWKNEEKPISVSIILNHKNQTVKTTGQFPLKIFIDIRAGVQPVTGAKVMASAYHPDGETSEFLLIDDGMGDPDVTADDGIYSSCFANYSTEGHYSFVFKIFSTEVTKKLEVDAANCCGSFMPYTSIENVKTFARLVGPVSIFLTEKPQKQDVFPPNQIFDMRVSDIDLESGKYTFQWTAAGDDYNHGTASSYQMKLFADRTELRYSFEDRGQEVDLQRDVLRHTPTGEYGEPMEFVIKFPNILDAGTYYFGVRAVDDAGNYGPVSNTVSVYLKGGMRNRSRSCDDEDSGTGDDGMRYVASVYVILSAVILQCLVYLQ